MKKTLLALSLVAGCSVYTHAQLNTGGLPLSMVSTEAANADQYVKPVVFQAPDLQEVIAQDAKASRMDPKPFRAGVLVNTNFSFPESGTVITLADGKKVWRGQLNVTHAPALVLYYDQFQLPHGVKLYLSNANKKQILGAYTESNNNNSGTFANEEVQGELVNFELDIDKGVNVSDIKLHVNQAAYMYRSIEHLQRFAGNEDNGTAAKPTADPFAGYSSVCEINAICPQGAVFPEQRKATLRIIMPLGQNFVGFCTGTLINNTKGDCTPYVLTATHCEGTNSKVNTTFSQWIFYYNFESPDCPGAQTAPNNRTTVGATFVSRADYNDNSPSILGDFLLLKLADNVPTAAGVYFAGWNRATTLPNNSTYINFHHPSGDMKKLAVTSNISPNGTFNQWSVQGTHWGVNFTTGGNEGGSSGSALFDVNGRIVGDLSGGSDEQGCAADTNALGAEATLGQDAVYSKISRNWEYPEGNGVANAQLKPWLDPTNTGSMTTNSLAANGSCNAPTTGITNRNAELENAISVYPNPVINGTLRMRVNLDKATDLNVSIYDVTGARRAVYTLKQAHSGEFTFDMSSFANGAYLISINNGEATTSKKVMLAR
ncbi:MAG: T9SS type A sorting domain-containing protein [Chitinophagaceae bacterium]|nr:MAG: T9SS type A sorting domain-containing protein [Chitinophagaceae bacterium]